MALVYLVQHGDKEPLPGDPGLTAWGRRQAAVTGRWLRGAGLQALYSSPLRRARQTADCIAAATGLAVQLDGRLGERANWDGSVPFGDFLADWARSTRDPDFVPRGGESSRQAADRLGAFLAGLPARPSPVGAVTPWRGHHRSAADPADRPGAASRPAGCGHPAVRHHHDMTSPS